MTIVGAGATAEVLSSNTLNVSYPSGIEAGDLLVLHVMHRSALTTPTGWELRRTSDATATSAQQSSVLIREADGTETGSLTITQATGARFMGQITALRGPWVSATATAGVVNGGTQIMSTGEATVSNGYAFASVSYVVTDPTNPVTNSVESGWTLASTATMVSNRLAVAYRDCEGGHTEPSVVFAQSYSTTSDHTWTVLRIEADLGSELISNGTFDSNITGWSVGSGGNLSWSAGALRVDNDPGDGFAGAHQTIATEAGKTYRVTVDLVASSANASIRGNDGPSPGNGLFIEFIPAGNSEYLFEAAGTETTIYVVCHDAGGYAIFDNISVREVL